MLALAALALGPGRAAAIPKQPSMVTAEAKAAAASALDPSCSCGSFCNGTCAATNFGKPVKLSVYRLTPYNVTDIADKDTGDAPGDMGFYFERFREQVSCTPAQANTDGCFLGYKPVVRRFMLEMDGRWGPFLRCNPLPFYNPTDGVHVDTKNWGCFPWHGERLCCACCPLHARVCTRLTTGCSLAAESGSVANRTRADPVDQLGRAPRQLLRGRRLLPRRDEPHCRARPGAAPRLRPRQSEPRDVLSAPARGG
jgi:hypothetical protein